MIKVSVIIPVYNAEQYITKCLESLLGQTLSDMEIIVVDDRGTDGSMDKVRAITQNNTTNKHIRIVEMPENSGAWAARNAGMKLAIGEYVGFVDADDWCDADMFKMLYSSAIKVHADWSRTGALKHCGNGKEKRLKQLQVKSGLFDVNTKKELLVKDMAMFWCGIYRTEFLRKYNIWFPKSKFSEDSYFFWLVVMYAESVSSVDAYPYHYMEHSASVSALPDKTKALQKVNIFKQLKNRLVSDGLYKECAEEIDYLCLKKGYIIPVIIEAINNHMDCERTVNEIMDDLYVSMPRIRSNRYYRRDMQSIILLNMFACSPQLISRILRLRYTRDPF